LILPLGLIVSEYVVFPLAFGVAAVTAALGAGGAGNFLAGDGTRTRLLQVVGITLLAAAALAALFLINAGLRLVILGPVFYPALICALLLAIAAALATWRMRSTQRGTREGLLTLGILAVVVASVPVVVFIAWLAGLAGA
jgi:hypothetical protein